MLEFEKNPNPTKDQHFMVDENMLELIYNTANIQDGESIVEVGGGAGALTDYLVQGNNFVTVIEKDPYYAKLLKKKYADYENVNVIEGNALDFNYESCDRIVANLPYTITEPFLINLARTGSLDYNAKGSNNGKGSSLKSITLVVSQNSTRKMVAPVQITEGKSRHLNSEFGIMGAITKTFCDLDIVTAIPSEAFFPEPAVTSFVINLTPKKEKTTVDRIMREMLIDKRNVFPTIKRIYDLLLTRGEIYKTTKHKKDSMTKFNSNFTSSNIANQNIYSLSNGQISQLVQDLIRNDLNIKSSNSGKRNHHNEDDYSKYFKGNKFVYNPEDDFDDDYDFIDEQSQLLYQKEKFVKKYDYMYDSIKYDILLHRGLEYVDQSELVELYGENVNKQKVRKLR